MNLSRRWFLIGGSSLVAAAALPALPLVDPPLVSRANFQGLFPYREVVDLTFAPDPSTEFPCFIDLIRPDGECIFRSGVGGRGGMIRWVSMSDEEGIVVTDETAFRIEITPAPAGAQVCTVFNVQPNRKKMRRFFSETFSWDKDGVLSTPPPVSLNVGDDSLAPADLLKDDPPRSLVKETIDEDYDTYV
jgi:hypothetical protein